MNRYVNVSEDAVRGIFKKLNHKNIYPKASDEIILRNYLDEFPTADVVEVVHGEWIATNKNERGYSDTFACSVCNSTIQYAYQVFKECGYKYCPYCGAKMDGKK